MRITNTTITNTISLGNLQEARIDVCGTVLRMVDNSLTNACYQFAHLVSAICTYSKAKSDSKQRDSKQRWLSKRGRMLVEMFRHRSVPMHGSPEHVSSRS